MPKQELQLEPQFIKSFFSAMVTNFNESLIPDDSVKIGMNVDFDEELGSAKGRLGTGIINAQLVNNKPILGLHNFRDSVGAGHKLFAVVSDGTNSDIYDVEAGTKSLADDTKDLKTRFVTFGDECLRLNGTDAEKAWNGAAWITTAGVFDLGNIPGSNKCSIGIEWKSRVYLLGDTAEPDRLYYSSVISGGAVSWTSGNGNVDIEPEDGGGGLKGIGKVPGYLLIFKERSMTRWNFSSAFPESLVNIGTPSHESIVYGAGLVAFFSASSKNARGFYITDGGRPVPISHDRVKNIKKWIDAIPVANESDISGFVSDRFFGWSIGDVTVDGTAYTNVVVRWNRILNQWSVRSYPTEFKFFSSYVDGSGNNAIVGGDDDGNVIEIDKGGIYDDYPSNTPITWQISSQEEDFGFNEIKEVRENIVASTRNAIGAKIRVKVNGGDWIVFNKEIKDDITEIKLDKTLRGNYFEFGLVGNQKGARATIKQIELPNVFVLPTYS